MQRGSDSCVDEFSRDTTDHDTIALCRNWCQRKELDLDRDSYTQLSGGGLRQPIECFIATDTEYVLRCSMKTSSRRHFPGKKHFPWPTHADVTLQNTYMGYLDYRKKTIKDLGISPGTCSFNPGVMVANMTEWKQQRITKQLEMWMHKNVE